MYCSNICLSVSESSETDKQMLLQYVEQPEQEGLRTGTDLTEL